MTVRGVEQREGVFNFSYRIQKVMELFRMFEKNFMKKLERENAKFIEENIYQWYLSKCGTHDERMVNVWEALNMIALPPMTEELIQCIESYIKERNRIFIAVVMSKLTTKKYVRRFSEAINDD